MEETTFLFGLVLIIGSFFTGWLFYCLYILYVNHLKLVRASKLETWCFLGMAALYYTRQFPNANMEIETGFSTMETMKQKLNKDY